MADQSGVLIPERLQGRPQYRGIPIPFVALQVPDEPPQFGANKGDLLEQALDQQLCALCGLPLEYWFAFIGSRRECYRTRLFAEPAMDIDCAGYACKICPYLIHGNFVAKHPAIRSSRVTNPEAAPPPLPRPEWLGLYITRGFKVEIHHGQPFAKADAPREIRPLDEI